MQMPHMESDLCFEAGAPCIRGSEDDRSACPCSKVWSFPAGMATHRDRTRAPTRSVRDEPSLQARSIMQGVSGCLRCAGTYEYVCGSARTSENWRGSTGRR